MGKYYSKAVRSYNFDRRAEKAVDKMKQAKTGTAAPKHKTTEHLFRQLRHDNQEFLEQQKKKHQLLDEHLKNIFVESVDSKAGSSNQIDRPLPQKRTSYVDTDQGVFDVNYPMKRGRVQLTSVFEFISQHAADPENFTPARIAHDHNLDYETVDKILKHYHLYLLYVPDTIKDEKFIKKAVADLQDYYAKNKSKVVMLGNKTREALGVVGDKGSNSENNT